MKSFISLCSESGSEATFLDLEIITSNGKISTKLLTNVITFLFLFYACQTLISTFTYFLWNCKVRDHSNCKINFFCCKLLWKNNALITWMEKQGGNIRKLISKTKTAWKVSKYRVFSRPKSKYHKYRGGKYWPGKYRAGKYWSDKSPYLDTFHAVKCWGHMKITS